MRLLVVCVVVASVAAFGSAETPNDFQISDFVEIKRNDAVSREARSNSLEDTVEDYMKTHDFTFKLPYIGSTLTFAGRNLDQDEVDVKLRFEDGQVDARKKKSKLKKIFVPIFVFILIKAMVMIPLALGILAIKTWNALQLSFGSFVVALALAVWQLCKKVAGDHIHPHIVAAHAPWEDPHHVVARSSGDEVQRMAYSAYAPNV
ncbi:uncharacterized protein LOC135134414 [Zophobas morio]|uniref:uncharacterized protein LOC135134414 n=1 Tax=Zophobas morio TaxID=2755281 RepID=UPI003083DF82